MAAVALHMMQAYDCDDIRRGTAASARKSYYYCFFLLFTYG